MLPRSVRLLPPVHDAMCAAAVAAMPREFAGILGGARSDGEITVHRMTALPAGATEDHFDVPAAAFAAGEAELRALGCTWVGFAHSHPRGAAAPSLRDRASLWRDCLQLIVAVRANLTPHTAAFWLTAHAAVPLPLHVVTEATP